MSERSNPLYTDTIRASGAITGGRFVKHDGAQAVLNEAAYGVARHDAADTEPVAIDVEGIIPVEAGGVIALGAEVQSNANGKAVTLAAGVSLGRAVEAAAADGDFIRVHLHAQ